MRHLLSRMLRCDWLVFSSCDWCISILAVSVCCSFGGPLSYGSSVVVFLDRDDHVSVKLRVTEKSYVIIIKITSFINSHCSQGD